MATKLLPTEVQLAIELQPCLAERRTYERSDAKHPCEFFADQGSFHAYDLEEAGPPPKPGTLQKVKYAGRRRIAPEMLSGCRKAPLMAVGINPNLPTFWKGKHNSVLPLFDDVLQYAHHYRYRAIGKLQIQETQYRQLLAGRDDEPHTGPDLTDLDTALDVELSDQTMYKAYQSLLDGLAEAQGWAKTLTVGEDLSYGNMVACGSPRWITSKDPKMPSLPVMTVGQRDGIVDECFHERRYFLRQLFQSLPSVLLVFSGATRDAIATAMKGKFTEGAPKVGESLEALLDRRIVLRYGTLADGRTLDARVLFVPHASGNPDQFAAARAKVVAALSEEVGAGKRLQLDAASGHLVRSVGACTFCNNALYSIGTCDYEKQLKPLAGKFVDESIEEGAEEAAEVVRENRVQERLLEQFLSPPPEAVEESAEEAGESDAVLVLRGRVVTMDDTFRVIDDGAVYLRGRTIEAVRRQGDPAPAGYDQAPVIDTGGTIYPGLIDLHNHVAYNALPPWPVGTQYQDRSQWRRAKDYKARNGIMSRQLKLGDPARAVARYVEVKELLGGTTSIQGLKSIFGSVSSAMKGLVRNVESAGKGLRSASGLTLDLQIGVAEKVATFRKGVSATDSAYFYHLSEGVNDAARQFWRDLVGGQLFGPALVGIHCLGVPADGFPTLAGAKASVVWSPTSNLMLYGKTLDLQPLLDAGVNWVLGCDWSPTGGKNPLFELKVAREMVKAQGVNVTARDLVAGVTSRAAVALHWQHAVGRIADGFRADLIVLAGAAADPYDQLIDASESEIELVMIDGVARAGTEKHLDSAAIPKNQRETVRIGNRDQQLWLRDKTTPLDGFTLKRATELLIDKMGHPDAPIEESAEEDGFELALDDEMSPLPSLGGEEEGAEEAAEVIAQVPDALVAEGDAALWAALRAIKHFPKIVDELEKHY